MTDAVVCFTTVGNEKEARSLAKGLVQERIAACVQVIPKIVSYYEWDGGIQEDAEALLLIKTRRERLAALKEYLAAHHAYEVPELLAVAAVDGLPAYLEWIESVTR